MSTQFEQHARDEFEKHQVPIDVESLWDNVYPRVKEEKKDRKFLWFFLSGFLIAGALFTAIYFLQKEDTVSEVKITTEQSIENATTNSTLVTDETKGTSDLESNSTDNNTLTTEESASVLNSKQITETSTKEELNTLNGNSNSSKSKAIQKENQQSTSTVPQLNNTAIPLENDSFTSPKSSSEPKSPATELIAVSNPTLTPQVNTPAASTTANTVSDNKNTTKASSPKEGQEELQLRPLSTSLFADDFLTNLNLPKLMEIEDDSKNDVSAELPFLKKLFKDTRIGIGLYGGLSGTSFGLSSFYDNDDYLETRRMSEGQLETIHLGLNVILQTKQNFYLRTGAEYTRIASLFEYKTENTFTSDSIPGIVEFRINNLTNDTMEVLGIVSETTIETYHKKTYNYFHLVDIPIILGYNFAYENWHFGLEAGVYTNVYLKRRGEVFNPENQFYDLATDENKWYKTNIGITPYIGLNAAYSINDNFQIHASPGFRFKKTFTTTSDASPAKEERASLGMQVGLRYFF